MELTHFFGCRWKNWVIRGIFTLIMILAFCLIIYGGPLALMITVCSPAQFSLTITLSILIYLCVCVFFHADPAGSGQMLRRDHLHRLSSVSHPRAAMVPQSFLVFLADIQLLFLRRKSGRLLWCCDKSCGIFAYTRQIPSILFVHILLHWLCVVCAVSSQKVLYETIQFVRLDTCGIADCCHTELSHHSEYFRRWVWPFASELSFFCDWIFKLMKLCVCTLQA